MTREERIAVRANEIRLRADELTSKAELVAIAEIELEEAGAEKERTSLAAVEAVNNYGKKSRALNILNGTASALEALVGGWDTE